MKLSLLYSATLLCTATFAFPASLLNGDMSPEQLAQISSLAERISREAHTQKTKRQAGLGLLKPGFDAEKQRVSTTGAHRYVCFSSSLVHFSGFLPLVGHMSEKRGVG